MPTDNYIKISWPDLLALMKRGKVATNKIDIAGRLIELQIDPLDREFVSEVYRRVTHDMEYAERVKHEVA